MRASLGVISYFTNTFMQSSLQSPWVRVLVKAAAEETAG